MVNKELRVAPIVCKEIQPKQEKLLSELTTGAQALMLLGKEPLKQGEKISLDRSSIIESARGIPREHKEKIKNASFNERDEFWEKQTTVPEAERMRVWRRSMDAFLDIYKKDTAKTAEQTFLKKILSLDTQKTLEEVNADTIYNTFMKGEGGGDVEFFARRIVETNNGDEIEQNENLIKNLGKIYGDNSTKISELLIYGIFNAQKNPDAFIKSAQENLDRGNYGDVTIWTALDKNSKEWEIKQKEKEQIIYKEPEEKEAKQVKSEIFAIAEDNDKTRVEKLLTDVQENLKREKEYGKGKLKATVQETAKDIKEYIRDGEIVFVPEGEGKLVVAGDIHGDLKTLKQVLEKSKFIENMEVGDGSMQLVQMGDLVDRGPKQVEVMQLVMELKRRYPKNVTIFRADHEVYKGVEPHEFNDKVKEFYGLTLDSKTEQDDPVFGGFLKVFEELPRMAVAANGAVMVHGGPAVKPRTLSELGNLPSDEAKRVFDKEITWCDPVTKSAAKNLEEDKAELIQYTQELLNKLEGVSDEKVIEFTLRKVTQDEVPSSMKLSVIRQIELPLLESLPDFYFKKQGKESKQELIRSTKAFLNQHEDEKDDKLVEFLSTYIPEKETQKVGDLKQIFEILKSTPGFYPNGGRSGSGSDLGACLEGIFNYSEDGLRKFLDAVGGKFMLRGHQPSGEVSGGDPKMFDGMLWTIHTTGKGSDESEYDYRESNPKYAVFPLNKQLDKIIEENIVPVWQ